MSDFDFDSFCFSNTLFREFALISMWRVPKMPIGAHMLLSFLAEPLKQPNFDEDDAGEDLHEFEDWVCLFFSFLLQITLTVFSAIMGCQ